MKKALRILAIVVGFLALINLYSALFIHKEVENYTIIGYSVSKISYLIYKILIASVLLTAGIRGKK